MKLLFQHELKDKIIIHFNNPPDKREIIKFTDDFYPSTYPGFGNPYGAFLGADFTDGWSAPIKDIYDKLDSVVYDENNYMMKKMLAALNDYRSKSHAQNDHIVSNPCANGPMDVAETLRGPDIYSDFYDRPSDVVKLLKACENFLFRYYQKCKSIIDHVDGGFFCWQGFWIPDNCYSTSDDVATNYSPDCFKTFTMPVIESLAKRLGGMFWIHLEGSAAHIVDNLSKIKGLALVQYTNNPKWPRGSEMIDVLKTKLGDVPLKILLSKTELLEGMAQRILPGNCIYDVGYDAECMDCVESPEEAGEIMKMANKYRVKNIL